MASFQNIGEFVEFRGCFKSISNEFNISHDSHVILGTNHSVSTCEFVHICETYANPINICRVSVCVCFFRR